jgi:hypothetical protein
MGFQKFMLNKGPGSPGYYTRALCALYLKRNIRTKADHTERWKDTFNELHYVSYLTAHKLNFIGGNAIEHFAAEEVIQKSEGDLPLFIFSLYCIESQKVRNTVLSGNISWSSWVVLEVILENVNKQAPWAVRLNREQFNEKTQERAVDYCFIH